MKSGGQNFKEALDNATRLDHLRGIADPGTSDETLLKGVGIDKHPDRQAKESLEEMVREDYLRGLK